MLGLHAWLPRLSVGMSAPGAPSRFPPAPARRRFVFHGVHMMLQFGSSREGLGKPWQPGEKRYNRVVFIGALFACAVAGCLAWHGMACQGSGMAAARHGMPAAWHGMTAPRHGSGMAWHGMAWVA